MLITLLKLKKISIYLDLFINSWARTLYSMFDRWFGIWLITMLCINQPCRFIAAIVTGTMIIITFVIAILLTYNDYLFIIKLKKILLEKFIETENLEKEKEDEQCDNVHGQELDAEKSGS